MLVDETRRIVDLIVDHDEEVFLGGVLRDVGVGKFLLGHCCVRISMVQEKLGCWLK